MRLLEAPAVLLISALSINAAYAWEANYPSGPVRKAQAVTPKKIENILLRIPQKPEIEDLRLLVDTKDKKDFLGANDPVFPGLFSRRTVAYPTPDGVGLGHGWDFLSNQKKFYSCVQYKEVPDNKYQTLDMRLQQTIDEETLDISLNTSFSASAKGTIEIVEVSGEAKFSLNASHHMSSSDTTFIVHGSATNGVVYAGPTEKGLLLRLELAQLASSDPQAFRDRCGDGFVASIGLGADLYVMLRAHTLTTEDKVDLETSAKASAGVADIFSGSASGSFSSKISDLISKKSLEIAFVQQGGIFTSVPTNLEEAKTKVQTFMAEEKNGPRSLFVTLVPYSDLSNWPGMYLLDTSDMRQRAVRYFRRLQTILYEIRNIRENYFREDGIKGDRYLFDYAHQLRKDDLSKTSENVRTDMGEVDSLLKLLDGPSCKHEPVPVKLGSGRERQLRALGGTRKKCEEEVSKQLDKMENFDDFRFWIELPLPLDGVSEKDRQIIADVTNTTPNGLADRQKKFKQALYRYWIERTDQIRCRLFFECLTKAEQDAQYKNIEKTIPDAAHLPTFPSIVVSTVLGCAGEHDFGPGAPHGCRQGRRRFSCDQRNYEVDAHQVCEVEKDSFRHSWSGYNSRDGNACGYLDLTFTCYNFSPEFPHGN